MCGEPGPVARRRPVQPAHRDAQVRLPAARRRRPCRSTRRPSAGAVALLRQPQAARRHLRRPGLHGLRGRRWSQVAEMLQAPVATSVSGKGVIPECHPLAVGWGYGPQGTRTAEKAFKRRRSSCWPSASATARSRPAFYCHPAAHAPHPRRRQPEQPRPDRASRRLRPRRRRRLPATAARPTPTQLRRPRDAAPGRPHPPAGKAEDADENAQALRPLRRRPDAVPAGPAHGDLPGRADLRRRDRARSTGRPRRSRVRQPRTYFNPTDNQAMGWSIPAAHRGAARPPRPAGRDA